VEVSPEYIKRNAAHLQRRYGMNGRSQMQGGKNWILPKEIKVNRFF
jgi:hypothetical protein